MKNAKKYGGTLLMKNKILALVLAGTMLFGQNVYATELVTPENNDVTENENNIVQDIDLYPYSFVFVEMFVTFRLQI